jgi:hypothetical protein
MTSPPQLQLHLMAGARIDYQRRLDSRMQHSEGQVGAMFGGSSFVPSLSGSAPISFGIDDWRRVVIEPTPRVRPGCYFIPTARGGLAIHLNL